MTPEQYLKDCCMPGEIPGYLFCQIEEDAKTNGWTLDQVHALKCAVEQKYRDNETIFPFPKTPRYV